MTAQFDSQSVADRVQALERQNGTLKLLSGLAILIALAALAGAVVTGFGRKTLRAERLVIQDSSGKTQATVDATDGAALHMYDASGRDRVAISVPKDGAPFIVLAGSKAHIAIVDDTDKPLWFVPASERQASQLLPCPANDPLGLFVKTPCAPLPGKPSRSTR